MKLIKQCTIYILFLWLFSGGIVEAYGQSANAAALEKMPADLEADFALSALPPHIRPGATVFLLDPAKGYYMSRQGTNGFICFVVRTEWERGEYRSDLASAISYDAEGAKTIFPEYADAEVMRASGEYSAARLKDTMAARFASGFYKAPAKPGLSYMLAPLMRTYPGGLEVKNVTTFSIPHYMFYAPYVSESDIGGNSPAGGPMILGDGKGPHGYIMVPVGVTEKAAILEANKDLIRRLVAYKPWFAIQPAAMHH